MFSQQHFPDNAVANKVASPAHEPEASKSDNQVQKKVAAKRGRPRLNPKSDSASENDTTPSPPKNKPAEVQNDAQTSTPKKGVLRKEPIKSKQFFTSKFIISIYLSNSKNYN